MPEKFANPDADFYAITGLQDITGIAGKSPLGCIGWGTLNAGLEHVVFSAFRARAEKQSSTFAGLV